MLAEQSDANSSNPFTAELVITATPSRWLYVFIICTHLCAAGVVFTVPGLEVYWRIILLMALCLSLTYCLLLHSNYWPSKTVQTLYWREFGGWELVNGQGRHLPVMLLDSSFSSLHCSVLNFKTRRALGNQRYILVLLADNCPLQIRQQLRRRMKLYIANKNK